VSAGPAPRLILASTSPYRRALLDRLGLPFDCVAPQADEERWPGESARDLCRRLAGLKAQGVAGRHKKAIVIGSDQVALRAGEVLGKPGNAERCIRQLLDASGQVVEFLTAVQVVDGPGGRTETHVDRTCVRFRQLDQEEVVRYVEREQPMDCAGGFKAEALGISLFDEIESRDPTALTGLPLIWLCGALRRAGLAVP
jgi:septum formation protein